MRTLLSFWLVCCRRWREAVSLVVISATGLIALGTLGGKSLDWLFTLEQWFGGPHAELPPHASVIFLHKGAVGDWTPYTKLLSALTDTKAQAVVFDFIFRNPAWNTNQSVSAFSEAVHLAAAQGIKIAFAARPKENRQDDYRYLEDLMPALSNLVSTIPNVHVGVATLNTDRVDGVVRTYPGATIGTKSALAWAVQGALANQDWSTDPGDYIINYRHAPLAHRQAVSLQADEALEQASRFKDCVVFVGDDEGDTWPTPLIKSGDHKLSGVEIHAVAYSSMVEDSWIRNPFGIVPRIQLLIMGCLCGIWFVRLTPRRAAVTGAVAAVVIFSISWISFAWAYWDIPWLIVVGVQLPLASGLSWLPLKSAFISHRSGDNSTAQQLASGLRRQGVDVYLALSEDQSGDLEAGLLDELAARDNFILIVSRALTGFSTPPPPDWVGEEIARALSLKKVFVLVSVDLSIKDAATKCKGQPPYIAMFTPPGHTHTPTNAQEVSLGELLNEKFQASYLTGGDPVHQASVIAAKLVHGIRKGGRAKPVKVHLPSS